MKRFIKIISVVFFILFTLTILMWINRLTISNIILSAQLPNLKSTFENNSPEKGLLHYWPDILADEQVVLSLPAFRFGTNGTADASSFLNPIVSTLSQETYLDSKLISLLQEHSTAFSALEIDWQKYPLDFDWFSKVHEFDHWNYETHEPFLHDETMLISQLPMIKYAYLIYWSKLYLLHSKDNNYLRQAILDVQHLARLVFTHENLLSSSIATLLISNTVDMYSFLTSSDLKGLHYRKWGSEQQKAVQRFFRAQYSFLDIRLTNETFTKVNTLSTGICQRVHETLYYYLGVKTLLKSEYEAQFERINDIVNHSKGLCRPSFVRKMWVTPGYEGLFKQGTDLFALANTIETIDTKPPSTEITSRRFTIEDINKYPNLGLYLGYTLSNIAEPDWLIPYKKQE